jgi:P-type Cu2+ transporter
MSVPIVVSTIKHMSSHAALPFNFRLLDEVDEFSQFSRPSAAPSSVNQAEWISSIMVNGMHCAACALNVERSLLKIPGVPEAQVNASNGHARVRWQAALTRPSQWFQAIVDAGYQALPAAQRVELESTQRASRLALWRWLVAGLCMMQVMMYAWPEYAAMPGDMSADALMLSAGWGLWMSLFDKNGLWCVS